MQYRRLKIPGGTFFFILVTHNRSQLFDDINNVHLLKDVIRKVKSRHPFKIDAFVVLPDHLHCIWTMPQHDDNFSMQWKLIKSDFTRRFININKISVTTPKSRKGEPCVWQKRFWEHFIRDEDDLKNHIEYIPLANEDAKLRAMK